MAQVSEPQLNELLASAPEPGSRWQHYRGGIYEVVTAAIEEEFHRVVVIYRSANSPVVWSRPIHQWHQEVTLNTETGIARVSRFTRIETEEK